ncbi:MAG: GAF domain-containing protein, partial [Anaerolineales bacterium]
MAIIFFLYGLSFFGLGLVALMRIRQGEELPLRKQLPWLTAFGFAVALTSWMDMFLMLGVFDDRRLAIRVFTMASHPIIGLVLLKFGWGIFKGLLPLPPWTIFIPGILIVPVSFIITYAATTFITPSPIEIPIDIWSRYLLYLPGSILAGIGFLRQWHYLKSLEYNKASNLMLAAAFAFVFEAFVVGLVVPAAPYGPDSYYNYDRVVFNAFTGEQIGVLDSFGLDYGQVLNATGVPIEFWRMLSAFAVSFFVIRGLEVFDESQKIKLKELQEERDLAQKISLQTQIDAKETTERWTEALVNINRQISNLEHVDEILINIGKSARKLLNSDFLGIALLDDENKELILNYYSNANNTEVVQDYLPVQNSIIQNVVKEKQHYFSKFLEPTEKMANSCFLDDGVPGTIACVYLNFDNHPIGAVWVARTTGVPYQEEDLIWLECMADQVVIAIQHGV